GVHLASHRSRHVSRRLLVVLTVIALLVPAGVLALRSLATSLMSDTPDAADVQLAQETASEPRLSSAELDENPFRGTPADSYPVGEAGIGLPSVTVQGEWTAQQVTQALQQTKNALSAARLDERVLLQGETKPYLDQFAQSSRDFITQQIAGAGALAYVTRLAPGYTLRAPVRVSGVMEVTVGKAGQLVISANYAWAYPLRAPNTREVFAVPGSQLALLRTVERYEFYPERGYAEFNRGLRPGDGEQYAFNSDCGRMSSGTLALPQDRNRTPGAPQRASYDYSVPPDKVPSNCTRRE
ncbi:MAG: hypothetical protein ACRDPW_05320, partial [Mycobacteriales bacterium]